MRTGGAAGGGKRSSDSCVVVVPGDALSKQFVRACQVGGAEVGISGLPSEHVRPTRHAMSSFEGGEDARDPDFTSPDATRKGKEKVTEEERIEGAKASQEHHLLAGDVIENGASSRKGKGKRKLHIEDDHDLHSRVHVHSNSDPATVETKKARRYVRQPLLCSTSVFLTVQNLLLFVCLILLRFCVFLTTSEILMLSSIACLTQ